MPSLLADITPLRHSRAFRRLWFGLAVTSIGSQLTVVALAYQAYEMTHSTAIVGLVSLTSLLPTLVGSLGGGTLRRCARSPAAVDPDAGPFRRV